MVDCIAGSEIQSLLAPSSQETTLSSFTPPASAWLKNFDSSLIPLNNRVAVSCVKVNWSSEVTAGTTITARTFL